MHAILVTMGADGDVFPYVGLGIQVARRHTTLRAYLQEANSGNVVAGAPTLTPNPECQIGEGVPPVFLAS